MSYLSLAQRVPEISALEPKAVTQFYSLIGRVPVVRTTHRRFIAGVLGQGVTRGHALDVGAGPGQATLEIGRQRPGLSIAGVDLAAHMVAQARRQAARSGRNGRDLWLQADGHELPLPDDSFDLVISSFALHHWEDPLLVLNEMARVLRRPRPEQGQAGGRYFIADVCREANPVQRRSACPSAATRGTGATTNRCGQATHGRKRRRCWTRLICQRARSGSVLPGLCRS
jgi:ubiquinone/menaquinone biosynthesis C-methylase UbiE